MPSVTKQSMKQPKPKGNGVLSRISQIGFSKDDPIKINLYGRSASGKTTLWATFPKKILALICSGGNRSGELRSIDTTEYRKTIDHVQIESPSEIRQIVQWQKEESPYRTIVVEHVTGLQDLVLSEILGLAEIPQQMSWGTATQQQYGQMAMKMKTILKSILDLDCNIVLVAQEREFNVESDDSDLRPWVASAASPSVVGWINSSCDYIVRTYIREQKETKKTKVGGKEIETEYNTGEKEYCLLTYPHSTYTTKFRTPKSYKPPKCIVDPDYEKIMKIIRGE